ncbi:MAG: hypothetical protein ACE5F1_11975 [Planctomycetota bacterium]
MNGIWKRPRDLLGLALAPDPGNEEDAPPALRVLTDSETDLASSQGLERDAETAAANVAEQCQRTPHLPERLGWQHSPQRPVPIRPAPDHGDQTRELRSEPLDPEPEEGSLGRQGGQLAGTGDPLVLGPERRGQEPEREQQSRAGPAESS